MEYDKAFLPVWGWRMVGHHGTIGTPRPAFKDLNEINPENIVLEFPRLTFIQCRESGEESRLALVWGYDPELGGEDEVAEIVLPAPGAFYIGGHRYEPNNVHLNYLEDTPFYNPHPWMEIWAQYFRT